MPLVKLALQRLVPDGAKFAEMSYTGVEFNGKHAQVDGTSYACVIAIALREIIATTNDVSHKPKWQGLLARHLEDVRNYPTNMIGGDLRDFASWNTTARAAFKEALNLARRKIDSFGGELPSEWLKEAIAHKEAVGYIQPGPYESKPFLETIRALVDLLDGIESY